MVAMIASGNVHLNSFGVHVLARPQFAQSHQHRFSRWLANRCINVAVASCADLEPAIASVHQKIRLSVSSPSSLVSQLPSFVNQAG